MGKRYLLALLTLSVLGNIALASLLLEERAQRDTPAPTVTTPATSVPEDADFPFIRVVDGDTITVGWNGDIEYVRLIGIDAPEPYDPGGPQCYATEAIAHLQELLQTGVVTLRFDETQGLRDKYGRILAYVELPDGRDVGRAMLENGYAREYTYALPYARIDTYKDAEAQAEVNRAGLWDVAICN